MPRKGHKLIGKGAFPCIVDTSHAWAQAIDQALALGLFLPCAIAQYAGKLKFEYEDEDGVLRVIGEETLCGGDAA